MIPIRTVVEHIDTGRRGVVCQDFMACCDPDEVPVVWDGEDAVKGTAEPVLRVIGAENAVPDPKRCGAGRGAECCTFLTVSQKGFDCERFGEMRFQLIFKTHTPGWSAKRIPKALYPRCFLPA